MRPTVSPFVERKTKTGSIQRRERVWENNQELAISAFFPDSRYKHFNYDRGYIIYWIIKKPLNAFFHFSRFIPVFSAHRCKKNERRLRRKQKASNYFSMTPYTQYFLALFIFNLLMYSKNIIPERSKRQEDRALSFLRDFVE